MPKAKPIQVKSIHTTYDNDQANIYRLKELIALAMLEYVNKNKVHN